VSPRLRSYLRHHARSYAIGFLLGTASSVLLMLDPLVLRLAIYDTQCGAKLFRVTPELREVFREPFESRWIFDVEILARLIALHRAQGGSPLDETIYELPLRQWRDVAGSKLTAGDFPRAALELARIYRRYLAS